MQKIVIMLLPLLLFAQLKDSGLLGAWRLDGNANDWSGNGKDGTIVGDPVNEACKFGNGYTFDGNDSIPCANLSLSTNDVSLCVWIKCDSATLEAATHCACGQGYSGNTTGFGIGWSPTYKYIFMQAREVSTADNLGFYGLANNQWHFLVLTRNGTTKKTKGYVDGVLRDSVVGTTLDITGSNRKFTISGNGYNMYPWIGSVDEILVFNRELQPHEVRQLMLNFTAGGM